MAQTTIKDLEESVAKAQKRVDEIKKKIKEKKEEQQKALDEKILEEFHKQMGEMPDAKFCKKDISAVVSENLTKYRANNSDAAEKTEVQEEIEEITLADPVPDEVDE